MGKFCKLFEVKNGTEQVLLTIKGYDHEDDLYCIEVASQLDHEDANVTATLSLQFRDEETYLKAFEEYSQEDAEQHRKNQFDFLLDKLKSQDSED